MQSSFLPYDKYGVFTLFTHNNPIFPSSKRPVYGTQMLDALLQNTKIHMHKDYDYEL